MIEEICQSRLNEWKFAAYFLGVTTLFFFGVWQRAERNHRVALRWLLNNPGKLWPPAGPVAPAPPPPAPPACSGRYLEGVWLPPET